MAFIAGGLGGLGGFKHRLSKMYQDTKNLYEFTEPPKVSDLAPELSSLHRKLRIQKDRLITWGLQWSDPGSRVGSSGEKGDGQAADIDESLDKAGLGDVVGSVLATIKEIIAEADPLWQSGRALMGGGGGGDERLGRSEKDVERKGSFVQWDRARFEGLVHDLTISIDTLYDISKNRQRPSTSSRQGLDSKQGGIGSSSSLETLAGTRTTQFASSRMQTPQQIDPDVLSLPGDPDRDFLKPGTEDEDQRLGGRQVVYMRRQHSSNNPWKRDGGIPTVPVLLEYAAFDPIFAATEIPPPMDRFEKLFAGLQTSQNNTQQEFHVPKLIGYFEDMEGARFGLIYELPKVFHGGNELESNTTSKLPIFSTISDLLTVTNSPPALEGRFRLAYNLATTVFKLLAKDIIHGNVAGDNVLFVHEAKDHPSLSDQDFDVRQPLLTNFDLFSDTEAGLASYSDYIEVQDSTHAIAKEIGRATDLRGLALLLLEIGLWLPIGEILAQNRESSTSEKLNLTEDDFIWSSKIRPKLRVQCGTLYMKAVQSCWQASNLEMVQSSQRDPGIQVKMYWKVVKALEKCCAIDEDFALGMDEPDIVLNTFTSSQPIVEHKAPIRPLGAKRSEKSLDIPPKTTSKTQRRDEKSGLYELSVIPRMDIPVKAVLPAPKRKLRLFPTTNLSQQHWDDWHDILMPRINYLLRGFYRKNPESVEISLVSMGETPQRTRPTILAICTSVSQVKRILKKSFSYDKSTYDLKVCKGKILRSRKSRPTKRSNADPLAIEDGTPAANTKHQMQPKFGASIGACVEGVNLPPVSLGGILQIDGTFYGMSVHHMLDDDEDPEEVENDDPTNPHRSSGYSAGSDTEGAYYYSSDDVLYSGSGTDMESSYEFETEDEGMAAGSSFISEPGDIEGIPVDCGDGYYVTQPAIDDVDDNFFGCVEDRDEDHVSSHSLGEMWASSGIRRTRTNGQIHEIDWALFTFNKERLPPPTLIQAGHQRFCADKSPKYPSGIVPTSELRDLSVHCMGRSSGLRAGKISTGMTSVKIHGRNNPSQSYEVHCTEEEGYMLGIPGDSGAWVVDSGSGRVCGSVLAWSQKKRVAYICPMDILVEDIAVTVEAKRICLGNGELLLEKEVEDSDLFEERGSWRNELDTSTELQRRTNTLEANESDESDDADDEDAEGNESEDGTTEDEETEEEENEASETRTIRNFKIPTAPIRMYNSTNSNKKSTKEKDIPDLVPALNKMRVSTDGTGLGGASKSMHRLAAK